MAVSSGRLMNGEMTHPDNGKAGANYARTLKKVPMTYYFVIPNKMKISNTSPVLAGFFATPEMIKLKDTEKIILLGVFAQIILHSFMSSG